MTTHANLGDSKGSRPWVSDASSEAHKPHLLAQQATDCLVRFFLGQKERHQTTGDNPKGIDLWYQNITIFFQFVIFSNLPAILNSSLLFFGGKKMLEEDAEINTEGLSKPVEHGPFPYS